MKKYSLFYLFSAIVLVNSCKQKAPIIDDLTAKKMLKTALGDKDFYRLYKSVNRNEFEVSFNKSFSDKFTIGDNIFYVNPRPFKYDKGHLITAKLDSLPDNQACLKTIYVHFPANNSVDYIKLKFKFMDGKWKLIGSNSGIYDGNFTKEAFTTEGLNCDNDWEFKN